MPEQRALGERLVAEFIHLGVLACMEEERSRAAAQIRERVFDLLLFRRLLL